MDELPRFEDLPLRKGDPPFSAWGLYGPEDQLGFLNRVTDDTVLKASKEIQTGARVSLNWTLQAQPKPAFSRQPFEHHILHKAPLTLNDDTWTFNTQSSSQWDGLRHFGYQKEQRFYNNVSIDDIHKPSPDAPVAHVNGIHYWAEKGIVGRGVLLDYAAWREKQIADGKDVDGHLAATESFKKTDITLADLKAVAAHQGTSLQPADILIVRSGYIRDYEQRLGNDPGAVKAHVEEIPPGCIGVERNEAVLKWIWENFSAVAGDQPGFESFPGEKGEMMLHEALLAGWGCPIGELWDLEKLSEECAKRKRWSFFLTSEPTNVTGAVASPPNALAIF